DVFVSADPSADRALAGRANGNVVRWWIGFGTSQLVVAWNPSSVFARSFTQVDEQLTTLESTLQLPGLQFCRADPNFDPEGFQTVIALELDQARSGQADLLEAVLGDAGSARATGEIYPEEDLGARLQSGACDAAVLYELEALDDALPFTPLAPQVDLGIPTMTAVYAQASYQASGGTRYAGAPISFTVTIPSTVIDAAGAVAFVRYLLGSAGRAVVAGQGLMSTGPTAAGQVDQVPAAIASLLAARAASEAATGAVSGAASGPAGQTGGSDGPAG
ncbi:MAG TPA: substrate-binding domain-containing protein, partial [Actinomycetota bacterium]|nr:substrate-binding domain-containing protein [Actinomycetota bacterium]